MIQNTVLTYIL